VLIQAFKRCHLILGDLKVEDVEVLRVMLATLCFRERHRALVEIPPQEDLRRRLAVLLGDAREPLVVEPRAPRG
jgi:hypothetical protein